MEIQGWMTEGELTFLHRLACSMPPGANVVEVGSWKGRSTVAICEGLAGISDARLSAVDTFRGTDNSTVMHGRHGAELAEDQVYLDFLANTKAYPFVEVIRDTSVGASAAFANSSIDWLFLDADHTFEQVRLDISSWYAKVKPGGIISGHDYAKFDVNRAVDTYLRGVSSCETVWHVRRPQTGLGFNPMPFLAGKVRTSLRSAPGLERRTRELWLRARGRRASSRA